MFIYPYCGRDKEEYQIFRSAARANRAGNAHSAGGLLEEAAVLEGSVDLDGLLERSNQTQHLGPGLGEALSGARVQGGERSVALTAVGEDVRYTGRPGQLARR
jgi:hypothetical protein